MALTKTMDMVTRIENEYTVRQHSFVIKKIVMIPEIHQSFEEYPFSLNFLLQCYSRCLDREFHETLSNEDPDHLARVQMFFFKSYRGQKFDNSFLQTYKMDEFIKVPLTHEDSDLELPANLQDCMSKCFQLIGNDVPPPHPEFKRFYRLTTCYKTFFSGKSG